MDENRIRQIAREEIEKLWAEVKAAISFEYEEGKSAEGHRAWVRIDEQKVIKAFEKAESNIRSLIEEMKGARP